MLNAIIPYEPINVGMNHLIVFVLGRKPELIELRIIAISVCFWKRIIEMSFACSKLLICT